MLDLPPVRALIRLALAEDLSNGDLTSSLTIPPNHRSRARIIARERLTVCGLPLLNIIVEELHAAITIDTQLREGVVAEPNEVLAKLSGPTAQLLAAERTMLNVLQRSSGVATYTAQVVAAAEGITVLDTRKTMPGWRAIDKYAVRIGGGRNHRSNLSEMVLVKNNHIDANGGSITETLKRVFSQKPLYTPVEVEVRSLSELRDTLPFHPQVVMLDNMADDEVSAALALVQRESPQTLVEVSGGLQPGRLKELKRRGVGCVSMGALTTQARNVDISLRIDNVEG